MSKINTDIHHCINVQLYAYDVVNKNNRRYLPESVKAFKTPVMYAVYDDTNESDPSWVPLKKAVGWMEKMYVTNEGVFADMIVSRSMTNGRETIDKLNSGEYCFVPRGQEVEGFRTDSGVHVIQKMTLYGFNLVKIEDASFNVVKANDNIWRIAK